MKSAILIFFMSISLSFSQDGWFTINSPSNSNFTYSEFLDSTFGIIISNKDLYLTTNGGETFENISLKQRNLKYLSLKIINKNNILVSGSEIFQDKINVAFIIRTTDMGKSWNDLNDFRFTKFMYFSMIRYCNNIIYCKENNTDHIIYSSDNGKSWIEFKNYYSGKIDCFEDYLVTTDLKSDSQTGAPDKLFINFFNKFTFFSTFVQKYQGKWLEYLNLNNNCWVIDNGFEVFKTWDNGLSGWFKINNQPMFKSQVYFKYDSSAYIIDYNTNRIFKTSDFIKKVQCKSDSIKFTIKHIFSVDKNIAYAVGDSGLIIKTTDGGGVFTDVEEEIQEAQEIKITNSKNSSFSLELKYPLSEAKLELINILGVPLFSQSTSSQILNISLEPYPTGIYLLKYSDKHSTQVFKLLRE